MATRFERQAISDVERLRLLFGGFQGENASKAAYYDGKQALKDLGISLPPAMRMIDSVLGWPGTVVDVLEERLEFLGWSDDSLGGLFDRNDLDVTGTMAHTDALLFGTSFLTVTPGGPGDPDVVVAPASPQHMVVSRDTRRRVVSEAAQFFDAPFDSDEPDRVVLFRPDETVWLVDDNGWRVSQVDEHRLGRVMVSAFVNRPRTSKQGGRSEITPAVRSYTDSALRTLVGAEVAREFYAVPQRYMMGAPESFFLDEDGNPRGAWDAMMGKILAIERDEDGEVPDVGSFTAHSMSPFFEQVRHYSQLLAAEASIPPTYLGFTTDNPSSADAIRMSEARLVKRAERRQTWFGKTWTEVARLALMVRDGRSYDSLTDEEMGIRPIWRDAATPTKAATTDQALKLNSMGVPFGEFMMHLLGMTAQEREMLERDQKVGLRSALMQSIQARSSGQQATDLQASELNSARVDPQVGE